MSPRRSARGRIRSALRVLPRRLDRTPVLGAALATQRRYGADSGGTLASTITYHGFLSLFPLILLGLSVMGFLFEDPAQRADWVKRLSGSIPGLQPLIGDNAQALAEDRAAIGVAGLLSLGWTGTGVVRAAGNALSTVYDVHPLTGVRAQAWALGALASLGTLMIVSIATGSVLSAVADGRAVLTAAALIASIGLDLLLFLIAYRQLTQRAGPPLSHLWPGALFTSAGWNALKAAGIWYATRAVANAEAVYGAFAVTIGVLVMLSLAARIFVYGAELNAVLVERRAGPGVAKAVNLARHRALKRAAP